MTGDGTPIGEVRTLMLFAAGGILAYAIGAVIGAGFAVLVLT